MARDFDTIPSDNTPMPKWFPVALCGGMIGSALLVGAFAWAASPSSEPSIAAQTQEEGVQVAHAPQEIVQP